MRKKTLPKAAYMRCSVPNCDHAWALEGPRQGFIKAAGMSHTRSHWGREHERLNHSGDILECRACKDRGFDFYKPHQIT